MKKTDAREMDEPRARITLKLSPAVIRYAAFQGARGGKTAAQYIASEFLEAQLGYIDALEPEDIAGMFGLRDEYREYCKTTVLARGESVVKRDTPGKKRGR